MAPRGWSKFHSLDKRHRHYLQFVVGSMVGHYVRVIEQEHNLLGYMFI